MQQKVKCESNILNESGFHPVSKDVNRIMKNFFDGDMDATTASSSSNGHAKVD